MRLARAIAVAIASLWGLYVAGINLFLSTSLFDKVINGTPRTIWVGYERAWSIVPGAIHADQLTIRGTDRRVEWIVRVGRVTFDVSFLDLVHKRFTAKDVKSSNSSFHLRSRMPAPALTAMYVEQVPPIPGLGRLPLQSQELPGPELWSDEAWHLWTVRLDGVVADDVRDIWIDRHRFQGDARIAGSFYLRPIREVSVGPVSMDVRQGRTLVDSQPVVETMNGHVDVTVTRFDPRTVDGPAVLEHLSVATALRLHAPDLARVPSRLTKGTRLRGDLLVERFDVTVENGVLKPGGTVEATLATGAFKGHGLEVRAEADVHARSTPAGVIADVDVRDAQVFDAAHARRAHVTIDAPVSDLANPFDGLHASLSLPHADIVDVAALDAHLPSADAPILLGGRADLRAHVEVWPGERRASGSATLHAEGLAARVGSRRFEGDATVTLRAGDLRWGKRRESRDISLDARIDRGTIGPPPDEGSDGFVELRSLASSLKIRHVDLSDPLRALSAEIDVNAGSIVDRGLLRAKLPTRIGAAEGRLVGRADVVIADRRARGSLDLSAPYLAFSLADLRIATTMVAHARVREWDWDRGDLVLEAASADFEHTVAAKLDTPAEPALSLEQLVVHGWSPRFSLSNPLAGIELDAKVERGVVHDDVAVNELIPTGDNLAFVATGARFSAEMRASIEEHVARGRVVAHAQGVGVSGKRLAVRGDVELDVGIGSFRLDRNELSLEPSRLAVTSVDGRFAPRRESDFVVSSIVLTGSSRPFNLADPSLGAFDLGVVVTDAELRDARSLNALLDVGPSTAIESGRVRASGDLLISSMAQNASGSLVVDVDRARLRVGHARVVGDFGAYAHLSGFDPETRVVDISGSRITARDVEVRGGSMNVDGWRGDLAVVDGSVLLSDEPRLDTHVRLAASDGAPIVALAVQRFLPRFFSQRLRAPNLEASAHVMIAPRTVAVRDLEADGGELRVRGGLVLRGDRTRGALILERRLMTTGLAIDDDGVGPRWFGLDEWFDARMRQVECLLVEPVAKSGVALGCR